MKAHACLCLIRGSSSQKRQITRKIKGDRTDPVMGLELGNPERPEADNLLGLYALLSSTSRARAAAECAAMGWGQFKRLLAEAAVAAHPLQERCAEIRRDEANLCDELREGKERAAAVANCHTGARERDPGVSPSGLIWRVLAEAGTGFGRRHHCCSDAA